MIAEYKEKVLSRVFDLRNGGKAFYVRMNEQMSDELKDLATYFEAVFGIAINVDEFSKVDVLPYTGNKDIDELYGYRLKHLDEIYVVDDIVSTSILVKNKYGLKNLYKLVSLSHTKYFHKVPRVPKSELERYRDGLLIGSGCECGELYSAITKGKTFDECCEIARFYDYIEIVPIENFKYFIEQGYADTEDDLKSINEFIIKIADHVSRPVVAVGDVHFLYSDDGECRKILMHNKGYSDYKNQPELILKCTEEMIESFSCLDHDKAYEIVVENSNYLAEEIDDTFEPFPMEMSYPKMDDSDERITMWSYIGARRKYGEHIPPFVEERLNWELEKIKENGYADLYLIAAELVKPSKRKGYVVGNRGCIASSLVAYFLEITEINPVLPHYYCVSEV